MSDRGIETRHRGIDTTLMDRSVKPGDDFYKFVNGGWMRTVEIPEDRSSWGSFHELSKETDEKVLGLLDRELSLPGASRNKAARLFESGMNTSLINLKKLEAIESILKECSRADTYLQIIHLLGRLASQGLSSLIHFSVHPDFGDSRKYAAYLEPADLGLPERDFYLDEDEKSKQIRNEYVEYLVYLLEKEKNYDLPKAQQVALEILSLETGLARHMLAKEQRRDIGLLYNPHSYADLVEKYPRLEWETFFDGMHIEKPANVTVTEPAFLDFLNNEFGQLSIDLIKEYISVRSIHHVAPFAHSSLEERHFDLYGKKLEGVEKMRPRKERVVKVVNQLLGEALGQLFVESYFPKAAKETAMEMVSDIVEAFRNRIRQLDWMSADTKTYALEKLASFRVKIGYPDVWKDYEELHLSREDNEGSYMEDLLSVAKWKFNRDANRIGQEVDREEWFMAPQIVNAYYNPMMNEIVFPAAILQPPFFDWKADAAVNYGGIGAVIGHEITHGFDDQGSRFDKDGNFKEWWTEEDRQRFSGLTKQLVEQFDAYYPFEDLPLNGTFTLGENIADLGGLSVAYDALQLYFERNGRPDPIDGFTAEQRFFISWATVWRTKIRPEALRTQIKTDPHPPGLYRAIAAPANLPVFYKAFEINPESPWYRKNDERIKIW